MKRTLTLIAVFFILAASCPAYAQETQEKEMLIVGISPAEQRMCLQPGDTDTAQFLISTNVDLEQNITIGFESSWVSGENIIYVERSAYYNVSVSAPEDTTEGEHVIKMRVCRVPDPRIDANIEAVSCIAPTIIANVSSACPRHVVQEEPPYLKYALMAAGLIIGAALVAWQVSNITGAKKGPKGARKAR